MTWSERAWDVINRVHECLSDDTTVVERTKAIDDAYPFGLRKHHPYKAWLKARKTYLAKYQQPKTLTPLEEAIEYASPIYEDPEPCYTDMEPDDNCWVCGGSGEVEHDCWEDTCCCLDPQPDLCPECMGDGTL